MSSLRIKNPDESHTTSIAAQSQPRQIIPDAFTQSALPSDKHIAAMIYAKRERGGFGAADQQIDAMVAMLESIETIQDASELTSPIQPSYTLDELRPFMPDQPLTDDAYQATIAQYGFILHQHYPDLNSMTTNQYMQTIGGYTKTPADMANRLKQLSRTDTPDLQTMMNREKWQHRLIVAGAGLVVGAVHYTYLSQVPPDDLIADLLSGVASGVATSIATHFLHHKRLTRLIQDAPVSHMFGMLAKTGEKASLHLKTERYDHTDKAIRALRDNDPSLFQDDLTAVYEAERILLETVDKRQPTANQQKPQSNGPTP